MALRLEDIELIKRLKHAYFRCIDTLAIDELRELLAADVRVDYQGGSYHWQVEGREELIQSIVAAHNPDVVATTFGHHPEIDVLSEREATGIWYLQDMYLNLKAKTLLTGAAIYRDRYVREDGAWRIKETGYTRIYERIEPVTEPPNLTAHLLANVKRH